MLAPSVEVFIDGQRVPDGCLEAPPDSPAALSGLTVLWGRDTTIDQPAPSALTFEMLDRIGGLSFLDVVQLGSYVTVNASATVAGNPTVPTVANPPNVTASGLHTFADGYVPPTGSTAGKLLVTPGPYLEHATDWDAVPRSGPAQEWRATLTAVFAALPAQQGITVRPALFRSPMDKNPILLAPLPVTGHAAVDAVFNPTPGYWVGLSIVWQPMGPAWKDAVGSWAEQGALIWRDVARLNLTGVQIYAPPDSAARQNQIFGGRVTDLSARFELAAGSGGMTVITVMAQDDLADLANRNIRQTTPWTAENLGPRWNRILSATGVTVKSSVPTSVASTPVSWRDVDNQPSLTLLRDLARTADGFVYAASHLGTQPTVNLYAMRDRPALAALQMINGVVVIVPGGAFADIETGVTVSACAVELDPIEWRQNVSDIATGVNVSWREQTVDDKGNPAPTERTETVLDAALEKAWGARRVDTRTELTTSVNAASLGTVMLARLSVDAWTINGVTIDTAYQQDMAPEMLDAVMRLLDATTRIGLPLLITDLPPWAPTPDAGYVAVFVEGGRFRNADGAWTLELNVSSSRAAGTAAGLPWNSVPTDWAWNEFDPGISWLDLNGVTV